MNTQFDPKIIAFACNWCAYSAADLAGVSRFQYPPNLRIIRVLCSGQINANFILKSFEKGADGVLVSGWHIGDCHYLDGNLKAEKMFNMTQELVETLGINTDRIKLKWISSAEGNLFAKVAQEFTEQIKSLGPLNLFEKAQA